MRSALLLRGELLLTGRLLSLYTYPMGSTGSPAGPHYRSNVHPPMTGVTRWDSYGHVPKHKLSAPAATWYIYRFFCPAGGASLRRRGRPCVSWQ